MTRNYASFREPTPEPPFSTPNNPMRPGKTREDKRIGAWKSKAERNALQATYRGRANKAKGGK